MAIEGRRWRLAALTFCGGFAAIGAEAMELPAGDVRFVQSAEAALSAEIILSEMASSRTGTPAVKSYASGVVDDYHKAELEMYALSDVDPASATLDPAVEKERAALAPIADRMFERRYLTAMVKYHQQAVALFQKQLPGIGNARLKELVEVTLARLSTHLDQARTMLSSMRPPS